jgi:hypothetical protein
LDLRVPNINAKLTGIICECFASIGFAIECTNCRQLPEPHARALIKPLASKLERILALSSTSKH